MTPEEKKQNHRIGMRLLAGLALEHGLRFVLDDGIARKTIEEDIEIVRVGNESSIQSRYRQAKKRKPRDFAGAGDIGYTPTGLILQGSRALLYLAKHKGYPSGSLVEEVLYYPTEAGFLASHRNKEHGREQRLEWEWQDRNLRPLLHRLFDEWGETEILDNIRSQPR